MVFINDMVDGGVDAFSVTYSTVLGKVIDGETNILSGATRCVVEANEVVPLIQESSGAII